MKGAGMKQIMVTAFVLASMAVSTPVLQAAEKQMQKIEQYGITWNFDHPVQAGQFVNGDWWVVGPVTVVSVTPLPGAVDPGQKIDTPTNRWGDTSLSNDPRMRNGSMVVLKAGDMQGYDSRSSYDPSLSVKFPYKMTPNCSLISTISNTTLPIVNFPEKIMWSSEKTCECILKTAAVLTIVSKPPPADAFRPPYAGIEKPIYRASNLKWGLLQNLKPPAVDENVYASDYKLRLPKDWDQMERYFQRPWLEHVMSWTQQQINPNENQPNYGREHARLVSLASLMLHLDVPKERKRKLLIGLIQYGIDISGVAKVGGYWNQGGGHTSGRKWPVIFASMMLDAPEIRKLPEDAVFHEDVQTYYGTGWFGQSALYWMVIHHGARAHYEEKPPEEWETWDQTTEDYRICCNAVAWVGTALSARLMKAIPAWNHDAFFDYCDRWMLLEDPLAANRGPFKRPSGETKTFDPFVDAMWRAYRATAPDQPMAGNPRMRVYEGQQAKWVPNPKPNPEAVKAHAATILATRLKKIQEQKSKEQEQERKAEAKYGKDVEKQYAAAKTSCVPDGTCVLMQAEKPSAEGGGKIKITPKPGAYGDAFMGWDSKGHWLEYSFKLALDGYYQIVYKYARGENGDPGLRSMQIDGSFPCDAARSIAMPNTGGWSTWRIDRLRWPDFLDKPYLVRLKAGQHTMRLENLSGGGVNLDYIVIAAPFIKVTTEMVEK